MAKITIERMNEILSEGFAKNSRVVVEAIGDGTSTVRLMVDDSMERPGGTVSGPSMMALADTVMWVCVMGRVGEVQLAVTTNLNINFLRKPPMRDIIAEGRAIKVGKRLAVLEVTLYSEDQREDPVAHATGTYSIPPKREDT